MPTSTRLPALLISILLFIGHGRDIISWVAAATCWGGVNSLDGSVSLWRPRRTSCAFTTGVRLWHGRRRVLAPSVGPQDGSYSKVTKIQSVADHASSSSSFLRKTKRQKNQQDGSSSKPKRRKMKKTQLNEMLEGMGLRPAPSSFQSEATPGEKAAANKRKNSRGNHVYDLRRDWKTQLQFARNGHAVLRHLMDPTLVKDLQAQLIPFANARQIEAWKQKVDVALLSSSSSSSSREFWADRRRKCQTAQDYRELFKDINVAAKQEGAGYNDAMSIPFLQYFHTWKSLPLVRQLVCGEMDTKGVTAEKAPTAGLTLPEVASILLDVPTIRLYQDTLFHKSTRDKWTPWHSDACMAPFDTSSMITFWIPLTTPVLHTGLHFVDRSHADFALPFWNEQEDENLEERYASFPVTHYMPLHAGDVTAHAGWTLHCANPGDEIDGDRWALAVTYVDAQAPVRDDVLSHKMNKRAHEEDWESYGGWIAQVKPRSPIGNHSSIPIVHDETTI